MRREEREKEERECRVRLKTGGEGNERGTERRGGKETDKEERGKGYTRGEERDEEESVG